MKVSDIFLIVLLISLAIATSVKVLVAFETLVRFLHKLA